MKTCSMCKKVKPFAEFHRDRSRSDGCQRQCRECKTVIAALRRRADLDAYAKAQRDWRAANPEAARRIRKRHYDLHPHEGWARRYEWRARHYGFEPVAEAFDRDDLIGLYGDACVYCGGAFEEIDHVIPVKAGGPHTLANVRPSCADCNRSKGSKMIDPSAVAR